MKTTFGKTPTPAARATAMLFVVSLLVGQVVSLPLMGAEILTHSKQELLSGRTAPADVATHASITALLVAQMSEQKESPLASYGNNAVKDLLELSPVLTARSFSPASKVILERAFRIQPSKETLLLAALAGMPAVQEEVNRYAEAGIVKPESGRFYGTMAWAAHLAKARAGDKASLLNVLHATRAEPVHTQVVVLLGELAYVTQPEVVEFIRGFVFSEERLESPKPSAPGLFHAQYAMSALSRMLSGFPVSYREDYSYTDEEIKEARVWLRGQTIWVFRNLGQ
jgi:hypothetical protein